ncbi:50S ribosomal protein L6 [Caenorhabditis elegans]|uniref:50S ribosomal protein L6 n=1 Tax=Caenorhabditis elegans TaxID=6239 RepID=H2KYG3_CAEEL|nr:50S ribosomal protein L6 [Caenorhabditis elegans]CCD63111.1 50S ribosomal protein L6 [Caenorhabditis elegans]|eukprot:NP_001294713.1 Uncharacterized protein CELE_C13F10.1 [Caenorhabditis elegans]
MMIEVSLTNDSKSSTPICYMSANQYKTSPTAFSFLSPALGLGTRCSRQTLLKHTARLLAHDTFSRRVVSKFTLLSPRLVGRYRARHLFPKVNLSKMQIEKPYDYAALMIRVSAGFVIFISLSLILLVVGNLIYTSFTERVNLNSKRSR